jgi:hypothetical protein
MIPAIPGNRLERTERIDISLPTEGDGQNDIRKAKTVFGFIGTK